MIYLSLVSVLMYMYNIIIDRFHNVYKHIDVHVKQRDTRLQVQLVYVYFSERRRDLSLL